LFKSLRVFTDGQLELSDSSLESQKILLELRLLLLKNANLALQFLILCPLIAEVLFEVLLDPGGLLLKTLSDFLRFDSEYIF
jgi:hypothetical protein